MNADLIPVGGENPYADHPGFAAASCSLRYTVTQRGAYGQMTGCGFGCEMTGGHCVPGEHCDSRRSKAAADDNLKALIERGSKG